MKTFIPFLVLIFLTINVSAQDNFKVIKVNGTILIKSKGTSLETGTSFSEKEDLLFRTEDATASVINSKRGRLILTNSNHNLSDSKSNFLPPMYNISSRGGSLINMIDLQNHFSGKYVILGKEKIELNRNNFPMDNDHFFYLSYIYKGEEINKKLSFSDDTLIIDKNSLYTVDGNPIPSPDNTKIKLFYRNSNESVRINEFDLIFPDTKQLKNEVGIILDEIKSKSFKDKLNEVDSYINEFYGKIYREELAVWLQKNFGLKQEN
jgi:hypothetical protein